MAGQSPIKTQSLGPNKVVTLTVAEVTNGNFPDDTSHKFKTTGGQDVRISKKKYGWQQFQPGAVIEAEISHKQWTNSSNGNSGQYYAVEGFIVKEPGADAPEMSAPAGGTSSTQAPVSTGGRTEKDKSIERQVALQQAVAYAAATGGDASAVIDYAGVFLEFLTPEKKVEAVVEQAISSLGAEVVDPPASEQGAFDDDDDIPF